jgi:hypothetical protein
VSKKVPKKLKKAPFKLKVLLCFLSHRLTAPPEQEYRCNYAIIKYLKIANSFATIRENETEMPLPKIMAERKWKQSWSFLT